LAWVASYILALIYVNVSEQTCRGSEMFFTVFQKRNVIINLN